MDMGGGLERQLTHPLYSDKLKDIEFETPRSWVHEPCRGLITKVRGTGLEKIDDMVLDEDDQKSMGHQSPCRGRSRRDGRS